MTARALITYTPNNRNSSKLPAIWTLRQRFAARFPATENIRHVDPALSLLSRITGKGLPNKENVNSPQTSAKYGEIETRLFIYGSFTINLLFTF